MVFANAWAATRSVSVLDAVVLVKGRVDQKAEGEIKIVALEVAPFEATADFGIVRLRLDARRAAGTLIGDLKTLIGEFPGEAPVMLELDTSEGPRPCASGPSTRCGPTALLRRGQGAARRRRADCLIPEGVLSSPWPRSRRGSGQGVLG